ncbi:MAG: SpoIIIAH-like family protein [Firmicutes bacterium]|nr:SpoIIIAH-like family protein [Bacillota bacterium]
MFYVIGKRTSRLILLALILLVLGLCYLYVFPRGGKQDQDLVDGQLIEISAETLPATAPLQRLETLTVPKRDVVEVAPLRTDFFSEYRWERERSRSRQTSYLEEIFMDPTIQPARRAETEARLWHLTQLSHKETELENLIRAKGHRDAVVVLTADSANVVVDGQVDAVQAAQIGEVVNRMAGVTMERITIIDGIEQ